MKSTKIPTKVLLLLVYFVFLIQRQMKESKAKLDMNSHSLWEDEEKQETSGREAVTRSIQIYNIRI